MDYEEEILADADERTDYLTKSGELLASYGWYIFAVFLVIGYFWKRIHKFLDQWYYKYEAKKYDAKYHKNPDLALERLEGLQRARQRMQEELDRKAREFEEKQKERELLKAQERIAKAEGKKDSGHQLGNGGESSRGDFFPLMGDTSRGYRAQKKKGCPGGGCGK